MGLDDAAVRAQISLISDDALRAGALIEWEYSTEIHSTHPLVAQIGAGLGLTAEQIEQAFIQGRSL
jgi:hypothetical protein